MLYEYKCAICGAESEAYNQIEERHTGAPICCGQLTNLEIRTAPAGWMGSYMEPYQCPVTNEIVTTPQQRREIMAREGLVEAADLITTHEKRQAKADKIKDDLKKFEEETPKVVKEHVTDWAKAELGLD